MRIESSAKKSAIVLLSGGLDSLVSVSHSLKKFDIRLALTFDYVQKSLKQEVLASKRICQYYSIPHKIVKLSWLKGLLDDNSDWVPNRNAMFINVAACFAESMKINNILIGINSDEAQDFKDNSKHFLSKINTSLKNSTNSLVKVKAPLINMTKQEIVELALREHAPLEYVYSCYEGNNKHCGKCRSCLFLLNALKENKQIDLIKKLF